MRLNRTCIAGALILVCQIASAAPIAPGTPAAMRNAADQGFKLAAGTYSVEGKNPNGTPYRGICVIQARSDGRYEFSWRVGAVHRGVGTVEGNTVTVEFGDTAPVVYQLRWDGSLSGTWAGGQGSEELRPVGQLRAEVQVKPAGR